MQVQPNSNRLALFYQVLDFTPVISPLKNLTEIFIKAVKPKLFSPTSSYGFHMHNKTFQRCAVLTVGLSAVTALIAFAFYKYYPFEPGRLSKEELLEQVLNGCNPKDMLTLADIYYADKNFEEAYTLYVKVYSMLGVTRAAHRMATMLLEGKVTIKNLKVEKRIFKADEQQIFKQLIEGTGVEENIREDARIALKLVQLQKLKEEAEKGNPEAMFALGNHFFLEQGPHFNLVEAKKWFTLAVDKKHPLATERLQAIIREEKDEYIIEKVKEMSLPENGLVEYYKNAAQSGHKAGMYRFAIKSLNMESPNKETALAYLKQAAEGGYTLAMLAYAQQLDFNKKDTLMEALKYFDLGIKKGAFSIYEEVRNATDEAKKYLRDKATKAIAKLDSQTEKRKFIDMYWALGSIYGILGEEENARVWFEEGGQLGSEPCQKGYEGLKQKKDQTIQNK